MRYSKIVILAVVISFYLYSCSNEERVVTNELRISALSKLESNLYDGTLWEKVHAAEFLIDLGYKENIYRIFIEEEKNYGEIFKSRIGVWRVLVQVSPDTEEKQHWINSIASAFKDSNSPDQIHAAESLAKLGVSPLSISTEVTNLILNGSHNALWLYTLWGTAYSEPEKANQVKNQFIDIIDNNEETNELRRQAAYALRNLKNINEDKWSLLIDKANQEPDTSRAFIYLLSSALSNTPTDSVQLEKVNLCKTKIIKSLSNPKVFGHFEALHAIGEIGSKESLSLLSSLMNIKNNDFFASKEDIESVASYCILRIDRREKYTLHGLDWGVITLYGFGMLLIGWYFSRKVKNTEDYLLGGRKMKSFAVGLSLFITMISSLSFLSYPGEMIKNGPAVFIGMLIFPLIYYLVGWLLIPKFMEMKITSAYELLEIRFGLNVRLLATFFFLTLRFFWMATIIYATVNTALITIIDIPNQNYSTFIGILLMLITIIYTTIGGYKAVITTDAIQSIILWLGAFLAIVFVIVEFNSFISWLSVKELVNWEPVSWRIDMQERNTIGNTMIYLLTWYICTNGSDQMAVQRYLSTKNLKAARRSFGISLIVTFIVKIFLAIVGIAMIAYFSKNVHFLNYGKTIAEQADNLLPKFILVGLPVGVSGLVVAGILAAAMSSLSSGLNSSSSVLYEDILKRIIPRFLSSEPLKQVKKISVIVGIIAIFLSLMVGNVEGNLLDVIIKVVNLFVAPLFVLFFMAIFIPFATSTGTIIGGISSVVMAVAIAFWKFMGIEVFWIMPAALITGALVGVFISSVERIFAK